MTRSNTDVRWGFRGRLTALIATVFVVGGAALLGLQYFMVQRLFSTAIGTIETGCADGDVRGTFGDADEDQVPLSTDCTAVVRVPGDVSATSVTSDTDGSTILIQQSRLLSQEVLSGLLMWSVITLMIFTAVAIIAASWLARRSFKRIEQITQTTRTITSHDLHQRLDLQGPHDEIQELGETIDTMLDRLEESFIRQERFITNASHELRTPLTTTRTALEIPLERGLVPDSLKHSIQVALASNRRSETLIRALLALARTSPLNTGVVDLNDDDVITSALPESSDASQPDTSDETPPRSVYNSGAIAAGSSGSSLAAPTSTALLSDLFEVTQTGVNDHEAEARARRITLHLMGDGPLLVAVDGVLAQLAIGNLIQNAIRHNQNEGLVWVRTVASDTVVQVEVSNTGVALTAEETALLVEPFNRGSRTRLARDPERLGLGLTLVDNIVRTHGGNLKLTPRSGGGLTCTLTLPRAAGATHS